MGAGETWRRMIAKCVRKLYGKDPKEACGTEQLCGGVEEGIEGDIHVMRLL